MISKIHSGLKIISLRLPSQKDFKGIQYWNIILSDIKNAVYLEKKYFHKYPIC